ncbi:MAG: PorV/PorQ family protein [Candidatus Mcinerneyibacterium aminivorans]|jgi:long-subunit fatty acid transport protein|uniref:PorV/PorQ family protein n=1 Tax=Candidatus Mcinerneyibacterium aminivorans TaxID=2703815 RepID=A0A5D0MD18_9BACT|nr:MAG: PorV/PorQ family protein [Candidatus Mcinerneyibacterium aminivorans]
MKKMSLLFLVFIFVFSLIYADNTWVGRTGGNILRINPSVRSMATGRGFISVIDGVQTTSINPAGLTGVGRRQVSFSHVELFDNFRVEYLGYAQKIHSIYLSLETKGYFFQYTQLDASENDLGSKTSYSLAPSLGLAFKMFDNLSVGISGTVLYENYGEIGDENLDKFSWAFNGGFQWSIFEDSFRIGASVRNVSDTNLSFYESSDKTPMPLVGNAGISYLFKNDNIENKVIVSADVEVPYEKDFIPGMGIEYMLRNWIKIRGGYRLNEDYDDFLQNLSFGLGITEKIKNFTGTLDYAYFAYGELGGTHRFSYTLDW